MAMSSPAHAPASGWFEDGAFYFPIRVYYEDTDFSGVVYHASYLRFMERGRSEFLRAAQVPHQAMLDLSEPLAWAVRRMTIDFAKPARVDDALQIRTALRELTGARMRLAQEVRKDGAILVSAEVEVCLITLDGRPRRVPDGVRKALASYSAIEIQTPQSGGKHA
jgi:acyl-CoA thioester hydrolase